MSSLFDIGKSGLQSYRQALAVTGQNIANINTDGYKRRDATLEEVATGQSGINSTGNTPGLGVRVGEIRRAFDEFLLNKARSSTAYAESTATFSTSIKQLEDLILPGEANLGAAIGRFFTGLQEIASTPNDMAARTVALEQAKQMADTFTETAGLIETYMQGLTTQANEQIAGVNVLTNEIASLNRQLATASGTKPNNSLLDSRDALIDKLSKLVEVNVDLTDKGVALVTLGGNVNGPRLVENERATTIGVERQNERMAFILSPNAENILTSQVTNGSLNGLEMAYATAVDVMAEIDNLAFVLVREMNAIHQQGLNLEGEKSGDLFRAIDVAIEPNPTNTGNASTEIKVNDFTKVQENRITFTYDKDAAVWNGRTDDGSLVVSGRNNVTLPGVEIRFLGAPKGFDQFIYDPVKGSAAGVAVAIKRPHDFAAASPLLVSTDPGNRGNALIDVRSTTPPAAPSLPSIDSVFSNNRSAVAATTFLSGGAVAVIPANASEIDMFSLASQSTARYSLSPDDLGQISSMSIDIASIAADGTESTKTVAFDVNFASVKGFDGSWMDFQQIADLINIGTITGVVQGSGETVTMAELGGFMSGNAGNLTLSLTENNIAAARMALKNGRISDGAVSARVAEASDIQIFTREGRHVAGTTQSDEGRDALQALMTADNGFIDGAVYKSDYLNKSGDDGYLGMSVEASYHSDVLFDVDEGDSLTTVRFSALEGIDTNEASVTGQSASARTVDYRMYVGDISASLTAADIDSPDGPTVAKAMIDGLRDNAPVASLIGTSPANIQTEDQLRLSFEGQEYTLKMVDGEPLISGGEDGRLQASFDAANHIQILSSSGSLTRSSIDIVAEVGDEENITAARRFGLMVDDTQVATRFAGEFAIIPGTGDASVDNIVTLTFDRDDSYNLDFVFDRKAEDRLSSTTDMAFTLNDLQVVDGNASAVATAINAAVAANVTDGDGGTDMTGIVSATAIGNLVQIVVSDGIDTEISAPNGTMSSGNGKIGIQYHAALPVSEPALAALQIEEDRIYSFKVNGQLIEVDSTSAGIRAATGGTLAGVIADATDAIEAAIDLTSGPGHASVTTANSVSGASIMFDMADASGKPIVVSDFQPISRELRTSGALLISEDMSSAVTTQIEHGEYPTDDQLNSGTALAIAPDKTGSIGFSSEVQRYQFALDINGDGTLSADETFTLDAATKNFDEELEGIATAMNAAAGDEVTVQVVNDQLKIANNRTDGVSIAFDAATSLQSDELSPVPFGTAYFKPDESADDDLSDDTDVVTLPNSALAISQGGLLVTPPDSTASLQLEEGKIFQFRVNGQTVRVDSTAAGMRAATGGTMAGVIADAADAIRNAAQSTSGVGTVTVTTANSLDGTSMIFDISDATGSPVVISGFDLVTRSAAPAGSMTVQQDLTVASDVTVSHDEYLTSDLTNSGTALSVAAGTTAGISFSDQQQRYQFAFDADGDGSIGTDEVFTLDGATENFNTEITRVADAITSAGNGDVAVVVNNDSLEISNNRTDGVSLSFSGTDALQSHPLDAATSGDAYFLSGMSSDATLEDEVSVVKMVNDSAAATQNGMIADAESLPQLDDSFAARSFDLRLAGDAIEVVAIDGAAMTDVSATGSSLAKQRYRLSNMPGEDLIMLVSNDGARRVSMQYDMLPKALAEVQRDIDIRVTDAAAGTVEMFDVATGTSLATRTLDAEQRASALQFDIAFTGALQDEDAFLIGNNADGIGDNRNIDGLLRLQTKDIFGPGSGGFQKVFSTTVAKLGAVVQSGGIAAQAAEALRDASLEAESAYTGVNMDTEAANLIEQQQAYQASARVLATARELFDTLIQTL